MTEQSPMTTTPEQMKISNAVSTLARERIDAGDYDPRINPDADDVLDLAVGAMTGRDTPRARRR